MQGGFLQSHTLGISRLFLASIIRVFLRLQVWLKLCKKKNPWFMFFLHACYGCYCIPLVKATCCLALFLRMPPVRATCCCCVTTYQVGVSLGNYLRLPLVKATCCCGTVFARATGEGNVLLSDCFVCTTGEGNVLLRDCFACTTGEGNVLRDYFVYHW